MTSRAIEALDRNPDQRAASARLELFGLLRQHARRIVVDDEILFLVEGDLLVDEAELQIYCLRRELQDQARRLAHLEELAGMARSDGEFGTRLISVSENGIPIRWPAGVELSYFVRRDTFPSQTAYSTVVASLERAARDWESVCGVRFKHLPGLDQAPGPGALFFVAFYDSGDPYVATSFFPNALPKRRRILIGRSYFTGPYDKVGALRHELGHVLGFAHEHVRSGAPPVCPNDYPGATVPLSDYDPQSVMHYFCGGVGSHSMLITPTDAIAAQKIYGPPF